MKRYIAVFNEDCGDGCNDAVVSKPYKTPKSAVKSLMFCSNVEEELQFITVYEISKTLTIKEVLK